MQDLIVSVTVITVITTSAFKLANYMFSSYLLYVCSAAFPLAAFTRAGALSPPFIFFNHHTASSRPASRKGSPLPGLLPNPSAACLSAFRAAHSPVLPTTCHSTSCHSSLLSWGNIRHHSVSAGVSRITLSRALDDVRSCQHA